MLRTDALPRRSSSSRNLEELPTDFEGAPKPSQIKWPSASPGCLLQFVVLAALSVQNTAGILINSAAMKPPEDGLVMWNTQSGVIYQEAFKTLTSLCLLLAGGERLSAVFASGYEFLRSGVPGFSYLIVNNLTYLAVAHLDPALFAVTQKLRILFAAMLTVFVLGTEVGCIRWAALVFLCIGVGLVQFAFDSHGRDRGSTAQSMKAEADALDEARGLTATLGAALISALAGVYCEKILKDSDTSIWVRNVHFSIYGCLLGIMGLVVTGELGQVLSDGLFAGYHPLIWVAVVNNGVGGILVSLAIKHVDVVASNFSQTVAIVFISLFSVVFLGREVNSSFVFGVGIVCSATFMYAVNPSSQVFQACVARMPTRANVQIFSVALAVIGCCIFLSQGMLSAEAEFPSDAQLAMSSWESRPPQRLPPLQPGIVISQPDIGVSAVERASVSQEAGTDDQVVLRGSMPSVTSMQSIPETASSAQLNN